MVRAILLVGAGLWALLGLFGLAMAMVGGALLRSVLPAIAISDDALTGAVAALALAALALAGIHAGLGVGLARARSWAVSGALLLGAVLATGFLALGAAALTALAAGSLVPTAALGAATGSLLAALAYAAIALSMVRRIGARPGS